MIDTSNISATVGHCRKVGHYIHNSFNPKMIVFLFEVIVKTNVKLSDKLTKEKVKTFSP